MEQTRLILVVALVATNVAIFQALPNHPQNSILGLVKLVLSISVITGFLFILMTAATLKYPGKYTKNNAVGNLLFTERFRHWCYNYCIDTFGVQIGGLAMFGIAYRLGWDFSKDIWDWRIGAGMLLSLSASALITYLVMRSDNRT